MDRLDTLLKAAGIELMWGTSYKAARGGRQQSETAV